MSPFKTVRADEVKVGDWVFGQGRVKEIEHYGCNVEIVYPAPADCQMIASLAQHLRGDLPVKVLDKSQEEHPANFCDRLGITLD